MYSENGAMITKYSPVFLHFPNPKRLTQISTMKLGQASQLLGADGPMGSS